MFQIQGGVRIFEHIARLVDQKFLRSFIALQNFKKFGWV